MRIGRASAIVAQFKEQSKFSGGKFMEKPELSALPTRHYDHPVFDSARWRGFEPRAGDILVCTPYKAGTTWMQMICALLVFQRSEFHLPLAEISPWMDLKGHTAETVHATYAAQDHRRIIKTHTPLDGLPWFPQATYLCVERDPRDIFMSMLSHLKNANPDADAIFAREMRETGGPPPLPEDPDEFFRMWLSNGSFDWESDGAPYWSVFRHGASFWAHRDEPNIHLVHYSDLKADREGEMRRIAGLLGIEVPEAAWPELVAAAGFERMKKNADRTAPDTDMKMWKDNSRFFNKGSSGQWQGVLSEESLALLDEVKARDPADYIDWMFGEAA
jgi:hypothetical protein